MIPQFANASSDARTTNLRTTLANVRNQIEIFKAQHNETAPGLTGMWTVLLGQSDTSEANIVDNIEVGREALGGLDVVHMGWTFQNEFSIRRLYEAGVRVDYSLTPRMRFAGRGVDAYDWSGFSNRPMIWHGVHMIPTYTYTDRLLERRFGTERVMLTTTTAPV